MTLLYNKYKFYHTVSVTHLSTLLQLTDSTILTVLHTLIAALGFNSMVKQAYLPQKAALAATLT